MAALPTEFKMLVVSTVDESLLGMARVSVRWACDKTSLTISTDADPMKLFRPDGSDISHEDARAEWAAHRPKFVMVNDA